MTSSTMAVRVAKKTTEAVDICSFELVSLENKPLPPFSAGSHIDVYGPTGIVRQYSLFNNPRENHRYLIAVLRDSQSRGGSTAMHDSINKGDVIQISEPKNHFPLAKHANHSVLMAGGIGITPILCMAESLANLTASFELHYCARSQAKAAFQEKIAGNKVLAESTTFYFDDESECQKKLDLSSILKSSSINKHLYLCGPKGFIDFAQLNARQAGWLEECIHFEHFAGSRSNSADESEFQLMIASSGKIVDVPAGTSALRALARHGIEIPFSCEEGVCGTCITRVLEGTPEHRDAFLSAEEQQRNDQFAPCCSRSRSPVLVLDL